MAILNNNPLVGASGNQGGYNINNSLRFRSSASAYLSRTPASAGNRKTFTWSGWFKKSRISAYSPLFYADAGGNTNIQIQFLDDNTLRLFQQFSGVDNFYLVTTQVFRDPSAWYHVVVAVDTTQATSSNRAKMYVNGVQVTAFSSTLYPTLNLDTTINSTVSHYVGYAPAGPYYFDGYLADVNFIDGSAKVASDFGETDTTTGVWKPKAYSGTYGTNGFYLKFSDIATTSGSNAGLGKDFSGNSNYWTTNNISVTSGTTYDAMTDSPTNTSATVANYAVLNPLDTGSNITLSAANLQTSQGAAAGISKGTIGISSGKWYWEVTLLSGTTAVGIADVSSSRTQNYVGQASTSYGYYSGNGNKYNNATGTSYGASYTTNDVIGVALDMDAGTLTFYKNNTSQGTAYSSLSGTFTPAIGNDQSNTTAFNAGQRPFSYTPPTGYVALNTFNLPTPTILQGNTNFNILTWTGTGTSSGRSFTGVGFAPDLVWAKPRSVAYDHNLNDKVRGANKRLRSNTTDAENTNDTYGYLSSFDSDGWTTVSGATENSNWNQTSATYVAWCWKANGAGSSNTSGSITSTVSVNTTAGFSVVTWTSDGFAGVKTMGHGLGVAPKMIIAKDRTAAGTLWFVYHTSLASDNKYLQLQSTAAVTDASPTQIWSTSSTTFGIRQSSLANNGDSCVAYCWAEIAGFSRFGSYTGNGSTDGPFIYTGFRPRYVMIKVTSITNVWLIIDAARSPYNVANLNLNANDATAENTASTGAWLDFTSNGFKIRNGTDGAINTSSNTYIFAAFAENPFKNSLAR